MIGRGEVEWANGQHRFIQALTDDMRRADTAGEP